MSLPIVKDGKLKGSLQMEAGRFACHFARSINGLGVTTLLHTLQQTYNSVFTNRLMLDSKHELKKVKVLIL